MPAPVITAVEHEVISVGGRDGVTPDEADQLSAIGELRPGFCERGYRTLRLSQYCGVVSVGERILEVLPKIDEEPSPDACRMTLLRLLKSAGIFPGAEVGTTGQSLRGATLIDVFISAFFDSVVELARGGLLKLYREEHEELACVRGRIIASRQFAALANRSDRVACQFDDLTIDNVWNRVIKLALVRTRPWIASASLLRRWTELKAVLDEVGDEQIEVAAVERLQFNRQGIRYRAAITWAKWIIGLLSPGLRAGDRRAPALLFDMNRLFESTVAAVLRRKLSASKALAIQVQETGHYLAKTGSPTGRSAFPLRPDVVVRQGDEVALVCDAKWKRLAVTPSGHLLPPPDDVSQMLAYASSLGVKDLALVYPWHRELAGSKETAFFLRGHDGWTTVILLCVDTSDDALQLRRGEELLRSVEASRRSVLVEATLS